MNSKPDKHPMMPEGDPIDAATVLDENNYRASRERIGDTATLVEDVVEGYKVLGEILGTSEVPPTDDIALAPIFLLGSRYHMDYGLLTCLRGHLSDSLVYTRRAIDACGYAAESSGSLRSLEIGSITTSL